MDEKMNDISRAYEKAMNASIACQIATHWMEKDDVCRTLEITEEDYDKIIEGTYDWTIRNLAEASAKLKLDINTEMFKY